jgi:F-type H+-transporting ATPase subunit b
MPQLEQVNLFISQVFWLALVFIFIYIFLARFFIPRISSVVGERESQVKSDVLRAEELLTQHKVIKSEIEKILAEARTEGAELRLMAQEKAEDFLQDRVHKFERELSKKIAIEEERLSRLKSQMQSEVSSHSVALSQEIFKAIIPSEIKPKTPKTRGSA